MSNTKVRSGRYALMSLIAASAVATSYGTAYADPTPAVPETISGSTDGIGYTLTRDDVDTFTTTLTGGSFRRTSHGIDVLNTAGTAVAHLPLKVALDEKHDAEITPKVDGATLVADVSAREIGTWRKTSPWERSIGAGVGLGAAGGALVGGFLGLVLGIVTGGILLPITLPVGLIGGLLIGMAAGGAAGAAVPNSQVPDKWEYQKECEYYGDYRVCW